MLIILKLLSPLLFSFSSWFIILKKKILQATKLRRVFTVKTSFKRQGPQQREQTQGQSDDWLVPLRSRRTSVTDGGSGGRRVGREVPCEGRAGGGVRKEEPWITARLWEHSGKARAWSRGLRRANRPCSRVPARLCRRERSLQKERRSHPGQGGQPAPLPLRPLPSGPPGGQAPVPRRPAHAHGLYVSRLLCLLLLGTVPNVLLSFVTLTFFECRPVILFVVPQFGSD